MDISAIDPSLNKLILGYRSFRQNYTGAEYSQYRQKAAKEQTPKVMMIACSDSRTNPAIITGADLGEVFTVNNVPNLVPPYKKGKDTHHSTSAALEFAVNHLKVEHVIVMGHSQCGGIRALMEGIANNNAGDYSFISPWVDIANQAKQRTLDKHSHSSLDQQCSHCERESLLVSLDNLRTFPWINAALQSNSIAIHAWHFSIETGNIVYYDTEQKDFLPLY